MSPFTTSLKDHRIMTDETYTCKNCHEFIEGEGFIIFVSDKRKQHSILFCDKCFVENPEYIKQLNADFRLVTITPFKVEKIMPEYRMIIKGFTPALSAGKLSSFDIDGINTENPLSETEDNTKLSGRIEASIENAIIGKSLGEIESVEKSRNLHDAFKEILESTPIESNIRVNIIEDKTEETKKIEDKKDDAAKNT